MSRSLSASPLALLAILACGACTETVIREVPADPATPDAVGGSDARLPSSSDNAGTASAGGDTDSPAEEVETEGGSDGAAAFADAPTLALDADTISGEPGQAVDCALALPCRWLSEDGGFAVTVTSGDASGARGGLSIAFRVDTLHDTEIAYGGASAALPSSGARPAAVTRALGPGNGMAPLGTSAGEPLAGRIDYDAPVDGTSLAGWHVALLDNGFVREAIFANLPIGPAESLDADCAFTLPCTWISGDGTTRVTLDSAGGFAATRRLQVGFGVTADEDTALALAGASALGGDGTRFESRTHALGTARGFEPLSAALTANIATGGSVDFRRTTTTPDTLSTLTLALYPDAPVPRWRVVFTDVPLR